MRAEGRSLPVELGRSPINTGSSRALGASEVRLLKTYGGDETVELSAVVEVPILTPLS